MRRAIPFLICLLAAVPAPAFAADPVGTVQRLQGLAEASRDGATIALAVGEALERGDVIRTEPEARLRALLTDGSQLTLGGSAELALNDTVLPGPDSSGGPVLDLVSGAFRLVAAKLTAKDAEARIIRTPVATIGIRGTDVWGGSLDHPLDVLLLEGVVAVTNAAGTTILDAPGEGTQVRLPGQAPDPAGRWSDDRMARAVATVAFADD
jgi:hypothetical protein